MGGKLSNFTQPLHCTIKKQKELKEKEDIIQHIRSMRYQQNNWFNEELNSTELHF